LEKINISAGKENLAKIQHYYNFTNRNELYLQAGKGLVELDDIEKIIFKPQSKNMLSRILRNPFNTSSNKKETDKEVKADDGTLQKIDFKKTYILNELNLGKAYELAPCCRPIPGDDILGYVTDDNMIQVHKRQCNVATAIKSNFGNRI